MNGYYVVLLEYPQEAVSYYIEQFGGLPETKLGVPSPLNIGLSISCPVKGDHLGVMAPSYMRSSS